MKDIAYTIFLVFAFLFIAVEVAWLLRLAYRREEQDAIDRTARDLERLILDDRCKRLEQAKKETP